jgi:DNA-binding XRE family transcriptional regulator
MKITNKLLLKDIHNASHDLHLTMRGLTIGQLIVMIREQLTMPQCVLSKLSGISQSTISRLEKESLDPSFPILSKIFQSLSCDLVIAPIFKKSIVDIRYEQAYKIARKRVKYLQGTMNLENQEPDERFIQELIETETEELLQSGKKIWQE